MSKTWKFSNGLDRNQTKEKIENIEKDVDDIVKQGKYKDEDKINELIDYRVRLNSKNLENYPDDFRDLGLRSF